MVKPSLLERVMSAFQFKDFRSSSSVPPAQLPRPAGYPRTLDITNPEPNPFMAAGSYGTISYGGYASEDYLATLRGKLRANVYDQMRRSDPQVKLCLSAVKNPIKSATWEIEPADDSDEAKADAALIEQILFSDIDFTQFIGEASTMVDFGHSVFEVIDKVVMNHPKFGSYNGIKSFAFRSQRTLERWNLDEATGDLVSVTQLAYGDLERYVNMPIETLLVFSLDKEGGNYEGISMLRPCYGPWFRKNNYLKLNAVGIEKFAIPTPMAEIPEGKENSTQYANLIQCLQAYVTHQNNYLTYPAGWKIVLNTNSYDPTKVETSIDNEDRRMVKGFLANFLELGMNTTGSYAMSNNLSDFFLSSLDHVAGIIAGELNKNIIPRLIKINKGDRYAYPKLKFSNISDKAGRELAEVLKFLGGDTQFIIPDDATEEHLRKRYRLPKMSQLGRRPGKPAPDKSPGEEVEVPATTSQPATLTERILASEARRKRIIG